MTDTLCARIINVYTALMERQNSRGDLATYIHEDEDFKQYLFDTTFFQGVFVSYTLREQPRKDYMLDELPWFTRRAGVTDVMSPGRRDEINDAFIASQQEEYQFIGNMDEDRSEIERHRSILFFPSGELTTFTFHDAVERGTDGEPSSETVTKTAQRLGLMTQAAEPSLRMNEMYDWMEKCLSLPSTQTQNQRYRTVLAKILRSIAMEGCDTDPNSSLNSLRSAGVEGLTVLAKAIRRLRLGGELDPIQSIAPFNVAGHARLREFEYGPRALVIYQVVRGPASYGMFFGTFEKPEGTAAEALSGDFINSLWPLLFVSTLMLRDVMGHSASIVFQDALTSWLRAATTSDRTEFSALTFKAIEASRLFFILIPSEEPDADHFIEINQRLLERWIDRVSDVSTLPATPLPALDNRSIKQALSYIVELRSSTEGNDKGQAAAKSKVPKLQNAAKTVLAGYLEDAKKVVDQFGAAPNDLTAVVIRSERILEVKRGEHRIGSVALSAAQLEFLVRLASAQAESSSSAEEPVWFHPAKMIEPTPAPKELAQFMHYLNKKVHGAVGDELERLFVSKGYGTQQYRSNIPVIRVAD